MKKYDKLDKNTQKKIVLVENELIQILISTINETKNR